MCVHGVCWPREKDGGAPGGVARCLTRTCPPPSLTPTPRTATRYLTLLVPSSPPLLSALHPPFLRRWRWGGKGGEAAEGDGEMGRGRGGVTVESRPGRKALLSGVAWGGDTGAVDLFVGCKRVCVCARARAFVRVRVCACVRVCARARFRLCVCAHACVRDRSHDAAGFWGLLGGEPPPVLPYGPADSDDRRRRPPPILTQSQRCTETPSTTRRPPLNSDDRPRRPPPHSDTVCLPFPAPPSA